MSDHMGETIVIGPLTFHRENGTEVIVEGEDETMGLLDNFYDRQWEQLRNVETQYRSLKDLWEAGNRE